MEQISRISTKVLVLNSGKPISLGPVEEAIQQYDALNQSSLEKEDCLLSVHSPILNFSATIPKDKVKSGGELNVVIEISSAVEINDFVLKALIYNLSGGYAADGTWKSGEIGLSICRGENWININIPTVALRNGKYYLAFNVRDKLC